VFAVSLLAILCFASATQGWLLIKTKIHEIVLLLAVTFALFRPDYVMNLIVPAYAPLDAARFARGDVDVGGGRKVRLHAVRETDYGDRFKLFVLPAPPDGASGQNSFGLTLEPADEGRYVVADLAFNGAAEQARVQFGDFITGIDVEQPGQPPKELVYPAALLVLAAVLGLQAIRRRRQSA
jgi:MYXO-CTERM domain-containing protein